MLLNTKDIVHVVFSMYKHQNWPTDSRPEHPITMFHNISNSSREPMNLVFLSWGTDLVYVPFNSTKKLFSLVPMNFWVQIILSVIISDMVQCVPVKDTPTSLQNMLKIIQFNQTKPQVNDTPLIVDILCFWKSNWKMK